MDSITFKRVAPHESRIYAGGEYVGNVYRRDDILAPGQVFYVVHLDEDPPGSPARARTPPHPRCRAAPRRYTHPLWS